MEYLRTFPLEQTLGRSDRLQIGDRPHGSNEGEPFDQNLRMRELALRCRSMTGTEHGREIVP
jgi:hypothetical protein